MLATMAEFFSVRTVAEVLAGFRPAHRTSAERVSLADAAGRVPADPVAAPEPLPAFARSTVDGYAVAAADTFGASESLPGYVAVVGAVGMGEMPAVTVGGGRAAAVATGAALPPGADAVVMVEHTNPAGDGQVELTRAVGPGENLVRPGEDVDRGAPLVPAGRALRPQDVGLLAAAGVTEVEVLRRPRVGIVSTGDELVPPAETPGPGRVRDANSSALAALVREGGGEPVALGIVGDDAALLEDACRRALAHVDVLVVSAGSSVGARDATARAVGALGEPGIWCHGIAVKPGKPTLLADVGGRPVIGLPGNPVSALVVLRLVGLPLIRRAGGLPQPPPPPSRRARLARNVASATGRLDVVQVRLEDDAAVPLFGKAALLSIMTRADGYLVVPEPVGGLAAGADVDVVPYA
jgi:molybdopterin molybdotransferase